MRLKISMIVVLGKDNILTKFHANPMHVVYVGKFGLFFRIFKVIKVRNKNGCLVKLQNSKQTLRVSRGTSRGLVIRSLLL